MTKSVLAPIISFFVFLFLCLFFFQAGRFLYFLVAFKYFFKNIFFKWIKYRFTLWLIFEQPENVFGVLNIIYFSAWNKP